MAYTLNMTGTAEVDDSIVKAYDRAFIIANQQDNIFTPESGLIAYQQEIGAESISLTRYATLTAKTTPLTEKDEASASQMSDTTISFTPAEYGDVITTTALANLQSGGKVNMAAGQLIGKSLALTQNELAIAALEASTNVYNIGGTAIGSLTSSDVMTANHLNTMYNKLARANVPTIGGYYVAIMHDDVIHDLRVSSGDWMEVSKYTQPEMVFRNEVGALRGFRIIRNNSVSSSAAGAGSPQETVYKTSFMGYNGLGMVESQMPVMTVTGPFDNLARFVNIGWYGVFKYGIVEPDAVWVSNSASSVSP